MATPTVITVDNPDGTQSSERTIGVNIDGKEWVIPTLVGGRQLSDEEAIKWAVESGLDFPKFDTVEEAKQFAKWRSKSGGAGTHGFLGKERQSEVDYLGQYLRNNTYQPVAQVEETRPSAQDDDVSDSWIVSVVKDAAAQTSIGLAARASGVWDYDDKDIGTLGEIAAGVGGFVLDPATYLGGGLGGLATKAVAKGVGKRVAAKALQKGAGGFAAKAALRGIAPGVMLGTVTAVRDPLQQYLEDGTVDYSETLLHASQSVAVGGLLGPASLAGKAAVPAEIGTFWLAEPLVHGRVPTTDDLSHAAGAVLGMKAVHGVSSKAAKLLRDYRERKAAGQKDPMPNADSFDEAGFGKPTRPKREEIIEYLEKKEGEPDETREPRRAERADEAVTRAKEAQEKSAAREEVTGTRRFSSDPFVEQQLTSLEQSIPVGDNARRAAFRMVLDEYNERGAPKPDIPALAQEGNPVARVALQMIRDSGLSFEPTMSKAVARTKEVQETSAAIEETVAPKVGTFKQFAIDRGFIKQGEELPRGDAIKPIREAFKQAKEAQEKSAAKEETVAPKEAEVLEPRGTKEADDLAHARGTRAAADIGGVQAVGAKNLREANKQLEAAGERPVDRKVKAITKKYLENLYSKKKPAVVGDTFTDAKGFRIEITEVSETPTKTGATEITYRTIPLKGAGRVRSIFVKNAIVAPVPIEKPVDAEPPPRPPIPPDKTLVAPEPSNVGRPELANPVVSPEARRAVDQVDQMRKEAGTPEVRRDIEVEAEAVARLEKDYAGEREKLMNAGREGRDLTDTDTVVARKILEQEWVDAIRSKDPQRRLDMVRMTDSYRQTGTDPARLMRQRRDSQESPQQRAKRILGKEIFEPGKADLKRIRAARARGDEEGAQRILRRWSQKVDEITEALRKIEVDIENLNFDTLDPVTAWHIIRTTQTLKADGWDAAYEYWRQSILSAPTTQAANIIGNMGNAGWNLTAQRVTEAAINLAIKDPKSAQFGELPYLARGILPGIVKGARNAVRTWRSEKPYFGSELGSATTKLENLNVAIKGKKGRVIRTPQRVLLAVDDFFKSLFGQMEAGAHAYRIAKSEKLSGEALGRRIAELMDNPKSDAWQRAGESATRLAFQERGGPITQTILQARRDIPGFRYLVPFVTTPAAIFRQGLRKSPLGSLVLPKAIWKALKTGDWSDVTPRMAEQALGWAALLILMDNDPDNPWITGTQQYGKNNPFPEQSIRFGDQWVSYRRVEPFATTMSTTIDAVGAWLRGGAGGVAQEPFLSVARQMGDKTFLAGIGDMLNVIESAARGNDLHAATRWATNFSTSWVPNLVRASGRGATDTLTERSIWGKGPEWNTRALRRLVQRSELGLIGDVPKVDLFGRDIPRDGSPVPQTDWLWRMLVPIGVAEDRSVEADRLLLRWNNAHPEQEYHPSAPQKFFTVGGERYDLTDQQYNDFAKMAGGFTLKALERIRFDEYQPTEKQIGVIAKVIRRSRSMARKILAAQWFREGVLRKAG